MAMTSHFFSISSLFSSFGNFSCVSLFLYKKITQVFLEKSLVTTREYFLPFRLDGVTGPNRSMWRSSRLRLVEGVGLSLNEAIYAFPLVMLRIFDLWWRHSEVLLLGHVMPVCSWSWSWDDWVFYAITRWAHTCFWKSSICLVGSYFSQQDTYFRFWRP